VCYKSDDEELMDAMLFNEIVVRIDHEKCSELFVELQICHLLSSHAFIAYGA